MTEGNDLTIAELNQRSRDILRQVIDAYVESGDPVGSKTLAQLMGASLSPASIRSVMHDLEEYGLLYAPHTSAGRLPTEKGLRLFVDGLLELGGLTESEQKSIEAQCHASGKSFPQVLEEASNMMSGLSHHASLVVAPKTESPLRHIEFVGLGPGKALVVLVTEDGNVENRLIEVPVGIPGSALTEATNYLNAQLIGRTVSEARDVLAGEIETERAQLDERTRKIINDGVATWSGDQEAGALILRGQAKLLEDVGALEDLESIRALFETMEKKESLVRLLEAANTGEGVQIFIGAENKLFNHAGLSMVISPFSNSQEKIVGAIGVIGPMRLNYARIIPMVDYTAKVIGRVLG